MAKRPAPGDRVTPYVYKPNRCGRDGAVKISDPWGETHPIRGNSQPLSGKKNNWADRSNPIHPSKVGQTDQFN